MCLKKAVSVRAWVRIFDYTQFAEPLRDAIHQNAEASAQSQAASPSPTTTGRFSIAVAPHPANTHP
jgi:hypothetical protein